MSSARPHIDARLNIAIAYMEVTVSWGHNRVLPCPVLLYNVVLYC